MTQFARHCFSAFLMGHQAATFPTGRSRLPYFLPPPFQAPRAWGRGGSREKEGGAKTRKSGVFTRGGYSGIFLAKLCSAQCFLCPPTIIIIRNKLRINKEFRYPQVPQCIVSISICRWVGSKYVVWCQDGIFCITLKQTCPDFLEQSKYSVQPLSLKLSPT
jgi:hypothetical protein